MDKYFDVIINNNSFYIVETYSKPNGPHAALATLKKIEAIVKDKLTYDSNHQDIYSGRSQNELFDLLKLKSEQISQGYRKRLLELNWVARKIFSKEKQVNAIHANINNYINPPETLSLSNELTQMIADYLHVSDLGVLAQLNREGKSHAISAFIKRGRQFGYKGDDYSEATKYIEDLFREVKKLAKQKVIPKKCLVYKKKIAFYKRNKLDVEKTLQNLQNLSFEDALIIFSNKKLYTSSFQTVNKVFNLNKSEASIQINNANEKKTAEQALLFAANNGDENICRLLLQYKIDINAKDQSGRTPLALAVLKKKKEVVQLLIELGADLNTVNIENNTLLIHSNSTEISRLLLEAGALETINHVSQSGAALHWAVRNGNLATIELLLKSGADINVQDQDGRTPLALAVIEGKKEIVQLLIKLGADVNIVSVQGVTPLIYSNSVQISQLLLEAGAKVTIDYLSTQGTALHCAVKRENLKIVELLLQYEANVNIRDLNGRTPLTLSNCINCKDLFVVLKIAKLLKKHKAIS